MLISQSWVTNLLQRGGNPDFSVSSAELDSAYVRVGFETEGYAALPEIEGPLVIGRVDEIEELTGFKKPIRYCQIDVGEANGTGEKQGIICGARNFRLGDHVVVALPGAVLPGGFEISARKTYDHISAGMMCSAAELGMAAGSAGIITLADTVGEPGADARPLIGMDDTVFDVNITPDRGYALSARGLVRELASSFDLQFTDPADDAAVAGIDTQAVPAADDAAPVQQVDLRPETKAQRFGLRKVTGIDPDARTPFWMERELMLSGQRPVSLPTDVTNYVMLLLGQPMHAFDAQRIEGDLTVRRAAAGEKFETLDHVERELDAEDVVIADSERIQSLAGVMGGTTSEITDATTDVLFEAATWDPITVARTSRRHKLSSESSRRFEREVDPAIVEVALDYACALLAELADGTIEAGRTLIGEVPQAESISLAADKPARYAGVDYSRETVVRRLREVGCEVGDADDRLTVTPPTWRGDLTMDVDLIEEILRLEGLEDIPCVLPTPSGGRGLSPRQRRRRAVGHSLAYSGYAEVLPSPFMANDTANAWGLAADDARRNAVTVQNPLEADKATLATTLLPDMLEAVSRNVARGRSDLALYGLQQVAFRRAAASPMLDVRTRPDDAEVAELVGTLPAQPLHVATVGVGNIEHSGPWGEGRAYSYADAIESARVVARACGLELEVAAADELPWHPGRCAALKAGGEVVGCAGELHPQVLKKLNLPPRTCAMELDLSALPMEENFPAPALSAYPALHQDIALVVDESIPAEDVRAVLREGAGDLLEDVTVFDVFRGDQLGADKKSLAFQLVFRAADRTLTDEEANEHRLAAAELAKERLGAEMRA